MESIQDLFPTGAASQLTKHGGAIIFLWIVCGLAAVVVLYLAIQPLLGWYNRRREAARASATNKAQKPLILESARARRSDFLEAACNHCETIVFVAKVRRHKPFFCPNCGQTNPPPKKQSLPWIRRVLRVLLYPSFQDRF
jgi:hypothetical protein